MKIVLNLNSNTVKGRNMLDLNRIKELWFFMQDNPEESYYIDKPNGEDFLDKISWKDFIQHGYIEKICFKSSATVSGTADETYFSGLNFSGLDNPHGLKPQSFRDVLVKYFPDISLHEYFKVKEQLIKVGDYEETGYYGSFTHNLVSKVSVNDLYAFLKENHKIDYSSRMEEVIEPEEPKKKQHNTLKL
jgi:hypothetical protein